jgi:hypothetical protein
MDETALPILFVDFEPIAGVNASSAITLANGGAVVVDFQWNEPWYGVTDDLDVYLINDSNQFVAGSNNVNPVTRTPFEYFSFRTIQAAHNTTGS